MNGLSKRAECSIDIVVFTQTASHGQRLISSAASDRQTLQGGPPCARVRRCERCSQPDDHRSRDFRFLVLSQNWVWLDVPQAATCTLSRRIDSQTEEGQDDGQRSIDQQALVCTCSVRHEHTSSPSVHRLMLWLCTHAAWRRKSVCGQTCARVQSTSNLHHSQASECTARNLGCMPQPACHCKPGVCVLTPTNQSRDVHRVALVVAAQRQAASPPTDGARPVPAPTAQPAGHPLV